MPSRAFAGLSYLPGARRAPVCHCIWLGAVLGGINGPGGPPLFSMKCHTPGKEPPEISDGFGGRASAENHRPERRWSGVFPFVSNIISQNTPPPTHIFLRSKGLNPVGAAEPLKCDSGPLRAVHRPPPHNVNHG